MTKIDERTLCYLFELYGYEAVRGRLDTLYEQARPGSGRGKTVREDRQILEPSLLDRYCRHLKCEKKDLQPVTLMTLEQFGNWVESGL